MIKETLIALVRAGDDALAALHGGPPAEVCVMHAPSIVADWPLGVVVGVRNGSLDRVHVGIDPQLAAMDGDRLANICEVFTRALASRSPTARTMTAWRFLPPDAAPPVLTGPRCFAIRFQDRRGALHVAAHVFSRGTYEAARASGYDEEVARSYLPHDFASRRTLAREVEVNSALALAGRLELDLTVESGSDSEDRLACRGVLLARHREQDGGGIVLSLDADAPGWERLPPGRQVEVCFGLRGRVFRWQSRVVRHETVNLVRDATLAVAVLSAPPAIDVSQRRREFRIAPPAGLDCRVRPVSPGASCEEAIDFPVLPMPDDGIVVEVLDLSFSGAGLLGGEDLPAAFPTGSSLEFWVGLPGRDDPLRLRAVVRQASVVLTGRNRRQGRLGVEFQPCDEAERRARQAIERHIIAVERQLACQRAVVAERQVV